MVASTARASISGARLSLARGIVASIHTGIALTAIAGGLVLLNDPSGKPLGLSTNELIGFQSFALPGALLFALAATQLVGAWFVTRPGTTGLDVSAIAGVVFAIWSAVQMALVKPVHPIELVMLVVGVGIYAAAEEVHKREEWAKERS